MYKNVFSQLSDAQKKKSEADEQREVEYLLSLRNDKTNADEAVILVNVILYTLTAFVIYLGFEYYQKTFGEMLSPEIAMVFAVALPAIIEIGKIKLVGKFFRAWSFGWMGTRKHWSQVAYWLFVGAIGICAFIWSYKISTGGIKEVAKENAIIKNKQQELNLILSAATANVDAQIAETNKSNAATGGLKKSNGRTNWEAQPILSSNAESLKSLYAQKEQIVKVTTEEYQKNAGEITLKVSAWASFIERFGGWGEWGVLACLIAIAFFERSLFEKNKDMVLNHEQTATPPPPFHNGNGNGRYEEQRTRSPQNHTPIGFFWKGYGETPTRMQFQSDDDHEITVTQLAEPVTQFDGDGSANYADDVLKLALTRLQGHAANFDRKHGKNETTAQNIFDILDQTLFKMKGTFRPTEQVHSRFSEYILNALFPLLVEKGFAYPKTIQFTGWLRSVGPQMQQQV